MLFYRLVLFVILGVLCFIDRTLSKDLSNQSVIQKRVRFLPFKLFIVNKKWSEEEQFLTTVSRNLADHFDETIG